MLHFFSWDAVLADITWSRFLFPSNFFLKPTFHPASRMCIHSIWKVMEEAQDYELALLGQWLNQPVKGWTWIICLPWLFLVVIDLRKATCWLTGVNLCLSSRWQILYYTVNLTKHSCQSSFWMVASSGLFMKRVEVNSIFILKTHFCYRILKNSLCQINKM